MDEPGKGGGEDDRPLHAAEVQREPERHADEAELVPAEEHRAEAMEAGGHAPPARLFEVEILCKREDEEDEQDILARPDNLCVGEAVLIVENEGADAA